jgi:uncharacterized delta-60 repeat protein
MNKMTSSQWGQRFYRNDMANICATAFAILTLALAGESLASTNGFDSRFGTGGLVLLGRTPVSGQGIESPYSVAVQSDGKILIAGYTPGLTSGANPQPTDLAAIGRLTANGDWDTTFANEGLYIFPGDASVAPLGGLANQVAVMSDGSIVASGAALRDLGNPSNDHSCSLMFKLSSTGSLDTEFGGNGAGALCFDFAPEPPSTTYNYHSTSIQIGAGDVIYLTTPQTNLSQGAVARFTPAGILDVSYGTNGIATTADNVSFTQLVLQQDGLLIATGGGATDRFATSGSLDTTFGTGGEFIFDYGTYGPAGATSVRLDALGRIVTGLYSIDNEGNAAGYLYSRLTNVGLADSTFNGAQQQPGTTGFAVATLGTGTPYLIAAQPIPGGGIFGIGSLSNSGETMGLMRLNDDSSLDAAYGDSAHPGWAQINIATGDGTFSPLNTPYSMAVDAAGRLLIGATFYGTNIDGACVGILRVIPDQLFANDFSQPPAAPTCPP